jgi:hypothetical protein
MAERSRLATRTHGYRGARGISRGTHRLAGRHFLRGLVATRLGRTRLEGRDENRLATQYDEFVALTVGFMQELDRQLGRQPSRFESSVLRGLRAHQQAAGLHRWGRGFMAALTLGSQGLKWRSDSAGAAVRKIASTTSASVPFRLEAVEEVVSAVLVLMRQRASRGPLGALAAAVPLDSPAHTPHHD